MPGSCGVWVSGGLCLEIVMCGLEQGCVWRKTPAYLLTYWDWEPVALKSLLARGCSKPVAYFNTNDAKLALVR